jgi:hypothetical protein
LERTVVDGFAAGAPYPLVMVVVAQRRLGPSSSTAERALASSAVQLGYWSRPTTTTRLPCSAIGVKNDGGGHDAAVVAGGRRAWI